MAVICKHFGVCGGCQSQDVPYPEQLARKRRAVQELLWHAAGLQRPAVEPVIGMPAGEDGMPRHFRHKAAFVFAPKDARGRGLVMGHYAFRSRRVVPVVECPVQSGRANALAFALRDHLSRAQVTAAGPRLEGILRHVVIRTTHDDREALVLLVVTRNDKSLRKPLRAFLASDGRPDGLFVTVHDRDDPYMVGDVVLRIDGRTHISETRLGPTYLLSPTAFFQTNPDAAAAMVDEVVGQAAAGAPPAGGLHVLDLYAGSGLVRVAVGARGSYGDGGRREPASGEGRHRERDAQPDSPDARLVRDRAHRGLPPADARDARSGGAGSAAAGLRVVGDSGVFHELKPQRAIYVSCNPEAFAGELPGDARRRVHARPCATRRHVPAHRSRRAGRDAQCCAPRVALITIGSSADFADSRRF